MERAPINGTTLNVRIDRVAPDAPWVVFSNSLVTDLSVWDGVVARLSGWNVLRYDQRGHGASDVPTGAVDFDILSDDLLAVMDHADVRRAVCVGLSMGVPTTLAAFGKAADRFAGLVLMDGMAKSAPAAVETWGARIEEGRSLGMAGYAKVTAERWLTSDAKAEALIAMIASTPFEGFRACATALQGYDETAVLPRISVPVLLVAGLSDGKIPETLRGLADTLGARFEGVENAGHVPCFEQPEATAALLADFLAEVAP
ncbi:alpha/beta fold hydrolase [Mangrovicoccus algicola]|uniref:Alpha/beta fold hydrolase n=1 Tax=Mangrovicoccus algicola TaxID=2771008 RepID=A0A8J6YY87_9RHOB|nr:alpha/beta fold hydrolase [Mangrovicoccus algicola]MBE3638794.1 alpha/beta fold hydrolase [Mangrovicoccus algicola]